MVEDESTDHIFNEARTVKQRIEELSVALSYHAARLRAMVRGSGGSIGKEFAAFYEVFTELYLNTAYHHKMESYTHNEDDTSLTKEVEHFLNKTNNKISKPPNSEDVEKGVKLAFEYKKALHQNELVEW